MNGVLAAGLTAVLSVMVTMNGLGTALWSGLVPLFLLALTTVIAAGMGRRVISGMALDVTEYEASIAGVTLGLGVIALGMFAFGACGFFRPWVAPLLLGGMWIYGWRQAREGLKSAASALRLAVARPWLFIAIAGPLMLALWACFTPPHQYDSLVYHVALPQEYLRAGRLYAPGGIVFAHFPQNGEMLFTFALSLGSDLLAQMIVWLGTALTVGWLLTFGRRLTPAAPWAALLIATHTAVLLLSSTTYVEPLVMLWITACWLCFEISEAPKSRGLLLLSAVFAGLALGAKYYAGLPAAILALRLVWRGRFKDALIFSVVAGGVFAPWLIKNWICVGNPVFPFLYRIFPARDIGWTTELASGYFAILTEYGHSNGWVRDFLSLPVLLFHNPLRFGGGMDVLGDLGWDLTLWLWAAGIIVAWRRRVLRGVAAFSVLYFLGWFSTGVVLRFLTALAPAMALVAASGVADWREKAGVGARLLGAGAAGLMIASHLFLWMYCHAVLGSPASLLALEDRRTFLSRRLDYYPCAAAANELPADANILVVGEQRGYYIPRAHRSSTVHGPNLYIRRANEAASAADLGRALRADGFTHFLIVPREAARLGESLGTLTSTGDNNWKGLEAALAPSYRGPACSLISLEAP